MAVVFLGEHKILKRRVAIKVIRRELLQQEQLVQRFFTEAQAAAQIQHEHVVGVLDCGTTSDGAPYIVLEYLEGRTLEALLQEQGPLPVQRALLIALQVLSGLAAAHDKGIVHRDLKPENVFLVNRPSGDFVKLLDFGLAKLTGGNPAYRTRAGALLGTPHYMSPEQCDGRGEVDSRSDLYSMGCILFRLLTGKPPFTADSFGEMLVKHLSETPPSARLMNEEVPLAVDQIIRKCLAKRREDRYQSAAELAQVLRERLVSEPDQPTIISMTQEQLRRVLPLTEQPTLIGRAPPHAPPPLPTSISVSPSLDAGWSELAGAVSPPPPPPPSPSTSSRGPLSSSQTSGRRSRPPLPGMTIGQRSGSPPPPPSATTPLPVGTPAQQVMELSPLSEDSTAIGLLATEQAASASSPPHPLPATPLPVQPAPSTPSAQSGTVALPPPLPAPRLWKASPVPMKQPRRGSQALSPPAGSSPASSPPAPPSPPVPPEPKPASAAAVKDPAPAPVAPKPSHSGLLYQSIGLGVLAIAAACIWLWQTQSRSGQGLSQSSPIQAMELAAAAADLSVQETLPDLAVSEVPQVDLSAHVGPAKPAPQVALSKPAQQVARPAQAKDAEQEKPALSKPAEQSGAATPAVPGQQPELAAQLAAARKLLDDKHPAEACDAFQRLLPAFDSDPEVHVGLGACHVAQNQYAESAEHYAMALTKHPGYPPAYFGLGWVYEKRGEHPAALDWYRRYLEVSPNGEYATLAKARIDKINKAAAPAPSPPSETPQPPQP